MSNIRLGKQLYIPGRIWTNARNFIEAFPHTKTSFAVVAIYDILKNGTWPARCRWEGGGNWVHVPEGQKASDIKFRTGYPSPIPNREYPGEQRVRDLTHLFAAPPSSCERPWAGWRSDYNTDKKYRLHRDVIRYALSPVKPIDFYYDFNLSASDETLSVLKAQLDRDISASNFSEYVKSPASTSIENATINNIADLFTQFQASAQPQWQDFEEIYVHNLRDVSQVPRNTICYSIVGKEPPVDEITAPDGRVGKIDWRRVEIWSALFGDEFGVGNSLLNAVAMNMPAKMRTRVENWQNPDAPIYDKSEWRKSKYKLLITEVFTYFFQDFVIEIGDNNNILVQYDRGQITETRTREEILRTKMKLSEYMIIGLLSAIAIVVTWGAVTAIAAGTAATAGTTATGAAAGAPTAVAGGTVTGSAVAAGTTATGAAATTTTGAAAAAVAAPTAVAGGATTGTTIGTVSTYASYISTGAGIVSKVAAAGGDTKTAETAGIVSAAAGGVSGGTGVYSGGGSLVESIAAGATPLLGTATNIYTEKQMKKLETAPMMGDTPLTGGYDIHGSDVARRDKSVIPGLDIPMEYLAIGGLALAALVVITAPGRK